MDGGQGNGGVQVACEGHEVGIEENKLRVLREGIQANKWSKNTKIMIMESMCANSIVTDVRELEWKWRCVMLYVLSIRTISYVCILKLWIRNK